MGPRLRRSLPAHMLLPLALGLALMLATLPALSGTPSAPPATTTAGTVSLTGYGGDSCTAPSESQMKAFWSNTRFSYWGIYIGGSDRGCSQPNLTSTWVSHMLTMGWDLLPLWVGPQNPCTPGQASYFSTNTSTAYSQGKAQALAAYNAWKKLSSVSNVPIDYDMEASGSDSATCRAAAQSFINGWVAQMHVAPAQKAGVYSSSCAGYLDDYAYITNKPDFIDGADWDNSASTGGISCVASNHWTHTQRHKQYRGGHNETMNGVTLNIDSRCSDGPVYGNTSRLSTTNACSRTASSAATAQLQAQAAPIVWHGSSWQAGGPQDVQLQRTSTTSSDTWLPVRVGRLPVLTHDVAASAAVIGRPVVQGDGSLLVPVTEHHADGAVQSFYVTDDGTHFTKRGTVPLTGAIAPGVSATTTALSHGRVLVIDPAQQAGTIWQRGHAARFVTHGLPVGAQSLSAAPDGTTLSAVSGAGTCPGKVACTDRTQAYRSVDGGRSWSK